MKRQIYKDYAYGVADLIWQGYDVFRTQAIERDKAALRDQGKLQNTFGIYASAKYWRLLFSASLYLWSHYCRCIFFEFASIQWS